ncbi:MAG TPA: DUF3817 domain-containing protein [Candidatus Saccharimonadales bacterium]
MWKIVASLRGALTRLEAKKPFTEREAWNVFRLAAIAEAFGWTLLITAVVINRYHLPGQSIAIPIAGQIHGTIFLAYFGVLIATYSSLRWHRRTAIIAALAGVPPYGTLVFEQFVAHARKKKLRALEHRVVVRAIIAKDKTLLACQPAENTSWVLPGAYVTRGESPKEVLTREVYELTGVKPEVGELRFVAQATRHGRNELELYFNITNNAAFASLNLKKIINQSEANDDIQFVAPRENEDLRPMFLKTISGAQLFTTDTAPVDFY